MADNFEILKKLVEEENKRIRLFNELINRPWENLQIGVVDYNLRQLTEQSERFKTPTSEYMNQDEEEEVKITPKDKEPENRDYEKQKRKYPLKSKVQSSSDWIRFKKEKQTNSQGGLLCLLSDWDRFQKGELTESKIKKIVNGALKELGIEKDEFLNIYQRFVSSYVTSH